MDPSIFARSAPVVCLTLLVCGGVSIGSAAASVGAQAEATAAAKAEAKPKAKPKAKSKSKSKSKSKAKPKAKPTPKAKPKPNPGVNPGSGGAPPQTPVPTNPLQNTQPAKKLPGKAAVAKQGPDLTATLLSATNIRIENIGTEPAVFPEGGLLASGVSVPPGGTFAPGQVTEVAPRYRNVICPASPTSPTWSYKPFEVDPLGKIAELREDNNTVELIEPFPAQLTPEQALAWQTAPGDIAVSLSTEQTKSGPNHLVAVTMTWTNVGSNYVYSCSNGSLVVRLRTLPNEVSGTINLSGLARNYELLAPRASKSDTGYILYAKDTEFGVESLLDPGCLTIEGQYDIHDVVEEGDETNNTVTTQVAINGGSCPGS